VTVRTMRPMDLEAVMHIERRSFSAPWEESTFRGLLRRPSAALLVAEVDLDVAGYSVMWFAADEGEIGDIAVLPEMRGFWSASRSRQAGGSVRCSWKSGRRTTSHAGFTPPSASTWSESARSTTQSRWRMR
jgi:hypothetical protein